LAGLTYARKAIIRCDLTLGLDRTWTVNQLSSELQEIVLKYPKEFAGDISGSASDSHSSECDTGSDDESDEEERNRPQRRSHTPIGLSGNAIYID
jgi:hypothetical protein